MRSAKKWIVLLIAMGCMFALAACGNNKAPDTTNPSPSAAPSQSFESKESSAPDEGSKPQTTDESQTSESGSGEIRIRLTFDGGEAIAVLEDNPTTQSLIEQLPVTLTAEDFGGSEKIVYFPENLSREGASSGYDPAVGDVACYGPWGNLAIYYHDASYADGLIPMGHIESGLDALSEQDADFEVTIEIIE
ncbi:MAG: hypothetical protein K0Q48_1273 [Bacillota bacterium]|jgi:hypothetical protein|nr:hypothetical protein [Bacillota bacterium]